MATGLPELRQKAKKLGVKGVKSMTSDELKAAISSANGSASTTVRKKTVKKAVKKNAATSAPAKKKTAKRQTSAASKKTETTTTRKSNQTGRNMIGSLDFSKTKGWNPRPGSAIDVIFKALKKRNGKMEKVFNDLVGDIRDFVPKRKTNGDTRTKAESEAFLRYRINRVRFDFSVATGQHKPSKNRAEYGKGGTGSAGWKRGMSTKAITQKAAKKNSTKPKSKKK